MTDQSTAPWALVTWQGVHMAAPLYFADRASAEAAAPTEGQPFSIVDVSRKPRRPIPQPWEILSVGRGVMEKPYVDKTNMGRQPGPREPPRIPRIRPLARPQAAGGKPGTPVPQIALRADTAPLLGHGELTCTARLGKLKRRHGGQWCVNGHEKTDENVYIGKHGDRQCRICRYEGDKRRAAKHRVARNAARLEFYYRNHDRIRAVLNERRRKAKEPIMTQPEDLGLSESEIYMTDPLSVAREAHGPITDEELDAAEDMSQEALRAWRESESQ